MSLLLFHKIINWLLRVEIKSVFYCLYYNNITKLDASFKKTIPTTYVTTNPLFQIDSFVLDEQETGDLSEDDSRLEDEDDLEDSEDDEVRL